MEEASGCKRMLVPLDQCHALDQEGKEEIHGEKQSLRSSIAPGRPGASACCHERCYILSGTPDNEDPSSQEAPTVLAPAFWRIPPSCSSIWGSQPTTPAPRTKGTASCKPRTVTVWETPL